MIDKRLYSVDDLLNFEPFPKKRAFREQTTECNRHTSYPLAYSIYPAGLVWAFTVYLEQPVYFVWTMEYGIDTVHTSGISLDDGTTTRRIELICKTKKCDIEKCLLNTAIFSYCRINIAPTDTIISGVTVDRIIPRRIEK